MKNSEKSKLKYFTFSVIIILTFIFYGNTILNDYALDDIVVITKNAFTQQGIKGIPEILSNDMFTGYYGKKQELVSGNRYRPFSMITFAIEKEIFGNNPHVNHFVNVLLFVILNILLFLVLDALITTSEKTLWYNSIPFVATILYLAHPVHTEAVANIKGRDEILALLFSLISFYYALKYYVNEKNLYLTLIFLSFLFAMFSKEISAVFILLIPLSLWFFKKIEEKKIVNVIVSLLIPFIIYLIVRALVLSAPAEHVGYSSLINNSFLEMNFIQKYSTIIYVIALYIKLLFLPYPLTTDYYPYHIPRIEPFSLRFFISALLIIFLLVILIKGFKKKIIYAYAISFFFISIAPVSNIMFPIGTFMSERFLFTPSIAFCIVGAYFYCSFLTQKIKSTVFFRLLFILVIFVYWLITFNRNKDWKDNYSLFSKDIKTSENSAWGNLVYGSILLEKAEEANKNNDSITAQRYLKQCFPYLYKALKIYPNYLEAYLHLGAAYYYYNKNYDSIIWAYTNVVRLDKDYDLAYWNFEIVFKNYNNYDKIIKTYEELYKLNPSRFEVNYMLGFFYGKYKNDIKKSLHYLNRAYKIKNNEKQLLKDLGVAYGIANNFDSSLFFLFKALELDTNDAQTYMNIAISYYNNKNYDMAFKYYTFAKRKDSLIYLENFEKLYKNGTK